MNPGPENAWRIGGAGHSVGGVATCSSLTLVLASQCLLLVTSTQGGPGGRVHEL